MEFELLSKLLPHEISKYVIETLETRLENKENVNRLSDHRSLYLNREVLEHRVSPEDMKNPNFAVYSSSCRLGASTLVLGQLCIRESKKTFHSSDLSFGLTVSLQKDAGGLIRRDTQEEKERQVQGLITNKVKECLNFDLQQKSAENSEDAVMENENFRPLEILMSLNVIQDPQSDGNLFCALAGAASDLLLQLHTKYVESKIVKKLMFVTTALQTNTKVVIDPKNLLESSLTNNIVLITSYLPVSVVGLQNEKMMIENIGISVDKGANMLRSSFSGASNQSIIQLEYQPCTLSLKQIKDILDFVKVKIAPAYFKALVGEKKKQYDVYF